VKVLAIVGGLFALILAAVTISYISASNYGNSAQVRIHTMYENNQNILASYGQKVAEAIGVTEIAADQMNDLITGANESRYGVEGAQATVLAVQEAFPNLDSTQYVQIQRIIEAGRNDFQREQTKLVDAKRSYVDSLGSVVRGSFLSMAGYPTINVGYPLGTQDDYPIITTKRASKAFETGVECGNVVTAAKGTDGCE